MIPAELGGRNNDFEGTSSCSWFSVGGFGARALKVALIFLTGAVASVPIFAQSLPDLQWRAGVDGGIPDVTRDSQRHGFWSGGEWYDDDAGAFQSAVNALPSSGGAVLVPAGTYLLRSSINLKSGAVLRGSGAADTHLNFNLNGKEPSQL